MHNVLRYTKWKDWFLTIPIVSRIFNTIVVMNVLDMYPFQTISALYEFLDTQI